MLKKIQKFSLITLSAVMLSACSGVNPAQAEVKDEDVIATIDKDQITQADLVDELLISHGSLTLQKLLIQEAILKELPKDLVKQAESNAELTISAEQTKHETPEDFESFLRTQGYDSIDQLKNNLLYEQLINKYIEMSLDTDKKTIQKSIDDKLFAPKIKARGILVDKEEDAKTIIQDLKDGKGWDKIHDEKNQNFDTYQEKGAFPLIKKDGDTIDQYQTPEIVPESVINAVNATDVEGVLDNPVVAEDGRYYVIEILYNGTIDDWDKHEEEIIDQYISSFVNNRFYVSSEIGKLIKKHKIEISKEEYKHILTGLEEAAGSFDEVVSQMKEFQSSQPQVTPVEVEEVEEAPEEDTKQEGSEAEEVAEQEDEGGSEQEDTNATEAIDESDDKERDETPADGEGGSSKE